MICARPNILLLYTDQQRWDSLGCYGNRLAQTPNLDRLAAEGALLEHLFVQAPVCSPSRMSFLSGRYCSSIGVGCNGVDFPENDVVPVHQILKPYGYRTAQIGKLHFSSHIRREHRNPPHTYGFDTFILSDQPGSYDDAYLAWVRSIDPSQVEACRQPLHPVPMKYGHRSHKPPRDEFDPRPFDGRAELTHTAFVSSEICRFLDKHGQEPFFAIAGFFSPHAPLTPPKQYLDRFDVEQMPLPQLGKGDSFEPRAAGKTPADWRLIAAAYAALVTEIDDHVGRILARLEEVGQAPNTLVIFTSDHGEFLGDHGRLGKGMPGHDCITRVPALVRLPGRIPPGRRISGLAESIDLTATLLDYAGVQQPSFFQGRTLRPQLDGRSDVGREDVLTESFTPAGPTVACLRTATHKYVLHDSGREILFDLSADPAEFANVVDDPGQAQVLSHLRKRMAQRLQRASRSFRTRTAEW